MATPAVHGRMQGEASLVQVHFVPGGAHTLTRAAVPLLVLIVAIAVP